MELDAMLFWAIIVLIPILGVVVVRKEAGMNKRTGITFPDLVLPEAPEAATAFKKGLLLGALMSFIPSRRDR